MNQGCEAVAANGTRRRFAIDNLPGGDDHTDVRLVYLEGFAGPYALQVIAEIDAAVGPGLPRALSDHVDQHVTKFLPADQIVDQAGIHGRLGGIAPGRVEECDEVSCIVLEGTWLQFPSLHHIALIAFPQRGQPALAGFFVLGRHVVPGERFDEGLELADSEYIEIHAKLLKRALEVGPVITVPID